MQEDRVYQDETAEINLIDLFWAIQKNWRCILAAMLILGVLLAGYGAFKEYRHLNDENFVKEQQEAYESDLETYEMKKKQLEKKLENLEEDLVRQELYEKNAVMLLFDQYNVYIQTASYFIDTGYEIAPELYFQNPNYTGVITSLYKAAVDRMDLDEIIATSVNPDLTARNPISGTKKMLYASADSSNGVLYITIYGDTPERTELIFNAVKKVIEEQEKLLNQVIGKHTISILSEESYADIDLDFGSLQQAFDDKSEAITTGIEETKRSLEELTEPVNETPTIASVIRTGIKFGVIGIIVGFILLEGFFLVRTLLIDKVYSVEDIRRRYAAPVLGIYPDDNNKKKTKLDLFLAKKCGIPVNKSKEDDLNYIISNLKFYLKENKKVLLVGNHSDETMKSLKDEISALDSDMILNIGGNINDSPAAVSALMDETAVVCVENMAKTVHKDIRHELRTLEASGNRIIGYIMVG